MAVWYNRVLDIAHFQQCHIADCQRCASFKQAELAVHQGPWDEDGGPLCGACSIWGVERHATWCR